VVFSAGELSSPSRDVEPYEGTPEETSGAFASW